MANALQPLRENQNPTNKSRPAPKCGLKARVKTGTSTSGASMPQTDTRQHAHDLIDQMAPSQISSAVTMLERMLDPYAI